MLYRVILMLCAPLCLCALNDCYSYRKGNKELRFLAIEHAAVLSNGNLEVVDHEAFHGGEPVEV